MQADALREESNSLRRENEGLMKEIEQLQADRCTDLEELVYLRWINACLRHELRHYQPPTGKTVARDLSKSLSPSSEKKAKQLILEYANNGEGRTSISDFDSDQWSSSQASYITDCDEYSPLGNPSNTRDARDVRVNTTNKSKIFGKLMKLMRGKDSSSNQQNSRARSLEKFGSREDSISNSSHFSLSMSARHDSGAEGLRSEYETPTDASRTSLDFNGTLSLKEESRRNSDVGSSKNFSPSKSGSGDLKITAHSFSDSYSAEKANLIKYAEALKESSGTPKHTVHRRAASYSSF